MPLILSKKTLYALREHLVSYTLREIDVVFGSADVPFDPAYVPPNVKGDRRIRVEQYYMSIDASKVEDTRRLLKVFEMVLARLHAEASESTTAGGPASEGTYGSLLKTLREDGFTYQDGRIFSVGHSSIPHLESIAFAADVPHLVKQLERIKEAADADPWLVIGTAKELVETACKTILVDRGKSIDKDWTLSQLCKHVMVQLRLTPDSIPNSSQASGTVKVLLGNLSTIVQCLAELRNPYGTGHGPEGRAQGLELRHANLAAGAASTLAIFLFETHQARQTRAAGAEQTSTTSPANAHRP